MDHKTVLAALSSERKQELTARSDRAGILHLASHFGAIAICAAYIAAQGPLWGLFVPVLGVLTVFLFTLIHECTHYTPFENKALNDAVGHLVSVPLMLPFVWFRYFHLAHHKYTNDPENDPELAGEGRPTTWKAYLIYMSGWGYWSGNVRTLWTNAWGTIDAPYLPPRQHSAMRFEARVLLGIYACALISLFFSPLVLWLWIIPCLIAQPALRLYLLAEHGHCPPVADMLENSRTTYTVRLVRWLAWNMPYHAEHHAFPAVPFHKLPDLHQEVQSHLKSTSDGYGAFTRDYVARLEH